MLSYRAIGVFHPASDVVLHADEYEELSDLLDYALTPALGSIAEFNKDPKICEKAGLYLEILSHWNALIEYGVKGFNLDKGPLSVDRRSAAELRKRIQWAGTTLQQTLQQGNRDKIEHELFEYPGHPDLESINNGLDQAVMILDGLCNQKISTGRNKRGR